MTDLVGCPLCKRDPGAVWYGKDNEPVRCPLCGGAGEISQESAAAFTLRNIDRGPFGAWIIPAGIGRGDEEVEVGFL